MLSMVLMAVAAGLSALNARVTERPGLLVIGALLDDAVTMVRRQSRSPAAPR